MAKNSSADDRRKAAREKARQIAAAQAKRDKTAKTLLYSGFAVVIVAVIVVVTVLVVRSNAPVDSPKAMAGGMIAVAPDGKDTFKAVAPKDADGKDVPEGLTPFKDSGIPDSAPTVKVFMDFQCPACNSFEQTNGANLIKWAGEKKIALEYYPLGLLDDQSLGNKYSTRATNAAYCAVDSGQGGKFPEMAQALFAEQPEEQSNGKTDDELKAMVKKGGIDLDAKLATDPEKTVSQCITDQTFGKYVGKATQDALNDGLSSTPRIQVNGNDISDWSDPSKFAEAVARG
jgi:protein-disulfide isomerase